VKEVARDVAAEVMILKVRPSDEQNASYYNPQPPLSHTSNGLPCLMELFFYLIFFLELEQGLTCTDNLGWTLLDPRVVPVRRSTSMADSEKLWLKELLKRW
jgi:hypothetical protein